ncbi:hypothetical protein ONZ45_g6728 [Pleurotus djamor]|nr:hypothetical protein ONZ45_g6728 [Pleurotus djamor]
MVSVRRQPRPPKKGGRKSSKGERVLCDCGCNKQVHPRTKLNHRHGRAFTLTLAVAYENKQLSASDPAGRLPETESRCSVAPSDSNSELLVRQDNTCASELHPDDVQRLEPELEYEEISPPDHLERTPSPIPSNASEARSDVGPAVELDDPTDMATFHDAMNHAQANMRRATVEDAEDSDEEEEEELGEPDKGEDFDDTTNGFGLEGDMLDDDDFNNMNEQFEQELADFVEELSDDELFFLRLYAYKTEEGISDDAYDRLSSVFQGQLPDGKIPSFKSIAARVAFLSAFEPQTYDCCINVCCCYTDPYKELDSCPYCNEPRLSEDGQPRRRFNYIPIIPRLQAYYGNASFSQKMNYRHNHTSDPTKVTDVMDGQYYKHLCQQHVVVDGKERPYKYFEDPRDVLLGVSSDGFAPFRRRKKTCWPLLVYNYGLPPEIRFHLRYILCAGIIPGPNKPKDFDSFAWPLYQEFLKLALGVKTYDVIQREMFAMRAYLVLGFGDIPAVSMMMHIKGHNGLCPCRMCRIRALRIPGSKSTTHYVPLNRFSHPLVQASPELPRIYDPGNLPLRSHQEMHEQGSQVLLAPSQTASNALAKEYGVKGIALLSQLPGISFPQSFPYDFMHLIFENVMKNLILLWTGNYKGLDAGSEDYVLSKKGWEDVGKACEAAGSSIPSAFGARPPNIAEDRMAITADTTSFFMQYLGPPLLARLFNRPKYFKHFIKLVQLVKICLQFEISREEIQLLRTGFQQWVQGYEKIYYQHDPSRLSTCPVTIHALLHIADSIEAMGPVWTYWAFPTERYCGKLQRLIKSRRHPFANLDNKVLAQARLSQIRIQYNLNNSFSKPPTTDVVTGRALRGLSSPDYASCMLLPPTTRSDSVDNSLRNKIIICLATRCSMTPAALRRLIVFDGYLEQWACIEGTQLTFGMNSLSTKMLTYDVLDLTSSSGPSMDN